MGAGGGHAPACPSKCVDAESWSQSKTKASTAYAINGVTNMQKDIMTNGPIQVAFKVYKSFMSYKTGVYQKHFYEVLPEGGHAVKIVGRVPTVALTIGRLPTVGVRRGERRVSFGFCAERTTVAWRPWVRRTRGWQRCPARACSSCDSARDF